MESIAVVIFTYKVGEPHEIFACSSRKLLSCIVSLMEDVFDILQAQTFFVRSTKDYYHLHKLVNGRFPIVLHPVSNTVKGTHCKKYGSRCSSARVVKFYNTVAKKHGVKQIKPSFRCMHDKRPTVVVEDPKKDVATDTQDLIPHSISKLGCASMRENAPCYCKKCFGKIPEFCMCTECLRQGYDKDSLPYLLEDVELPCLLE